MALYAPGHARRQTRFHARVRQALRLDQGAIETARSRAAQQGNSTLIELYWQIGQLILQRQEEQGWGKKVIKRLSVDLRMAYPEMKGFSERNLQYMATMASAWPEEIAPQLWRNLAWGHIRVILDGCDERMTRDFYVQRAVAQGGRGPSWRP
jgi:predicted nuclease of restriction endonuclease-like (RecB) superfamily